MSEHAHPQDQEPLLPPESKVSPSSSRGEHRSGGRSIDVGRTFFFGLVGGVGSACFYALYQRLPDEQQERIKEQARGFITSRINDLRSNLNL